MKKLTTIMVMGLFAILSSPTHAQTESPKPGLYQCPINYTEYVDISIAPGEDFPSFGGNLEVPRERKEVLLLEFKGVDVTVVNPQALPNWLLINEPQYKNQGSFFWDNEDGTRTFQIDWSHTWYFGSTFRMEPTQIAQDSFSTSLQFDDNDGWYQTLGQINCQKL